MLRKIVFASVLDTAIEVRTPLHNCSWPIPRYKVVIQNIVEKEWKEETVR